jgi:hypothetical protein
LIQVNLNCIKMKKYRCINCQSEDVEAKCWVNLKTMKPELPENDDIDISECWCINCQDHVIIEYYDDDELT